MAGQVCLIENILASLPIYYMSLFCMPKGVVKQIMSMECKFIWSGASAKQKAHKLIWNMAVREVERGGPGIGSITTKIKALFFKWLSRNHEGWEDHFINREHKPSFKNGLTLFTKRLSPVWSGIYTTGMMSELVSSLCLSFILDYTTYLLIKWLLYEIEILEAQILP